MQQGRRGRLGRLITSCLCVMHCINGIVVHRCLFSCLCLAQCVRVCALFVGSTVRLAAAKVFQSTMANAESDRMDEKNRALAFFYRNPPPGSGVKPLPYSAICKLVRKKNGKQPGKSAVHKAVSTFKKTSLPRGRKTGWRKSTTGEDNAMVTTMLRLRGGGLGVTSQEVRNALPAALRRKISSKTVRRRLAERGYHPTVKSEKSDFGPSWRKARLAFCKSLRSRSPGQWCRYVQGVADIKEVTYYPRVLKARAARAADSWTYMRQNERLKPEFVRPKKPFTQKEMRRTKKMKVFAVALSIGSVVACEVPLSFDSAAWRKAVRSVVGPALRNLYPDNRHIVILLDGEKPFHSAESKREMRKWGLKALPGWPSRSPDLNPAENMWPALKKRMKNMEQKSDKFANFKRKLLKAARMYSGSEKLVQSMAGRMNDCIARRGGILPK